MSKNNQGLPEQQAEQAFVALQALKGLAQPATNKPVMFAEILQYVLGNSNIDVERVTKALGSDLTKRRIYNQLLSENRIAYGPREAHAQDNDVIDLRAGEGFSIKLRISRARPEQVFIILEVAHPEQFAADKPVMLHISGDNEQARLDFPALVDGKSQLILADSDHRLLALRNTDTELSLV